MAPKVEIITPEIRRFIKQALAEDLGSGDITTLLTVPKGRECTARLIIKSDCVLAGMPFFTETMRIIDPKVKVTLRKKDGARCRPGDIAAIIKGKAASVLMAERVGLNILQRTSGIATLTRAFVDAVSGLQVKILDTRKTTPCMRSMEKYAVRVGGGSNHRMGLYDAVLIKDNHIAAAGSAAKAIRAAKAGLRKTAQTIEIECKSMAQVREALAEGVDIIMLDNMTLAEMKRCVKLIDHWALVEASGGVSLKNVRSIAKTGVDVISVGALTHSAPSADISLDITL